MIFDRKFDLLLDIDVKFRGQQKGITDFFFFFFVWYATACPRRVEDFINFYGIWLIWLMKGALIPQAKSALSVVVLSPNEKSPLQPGRNPSPTDIKVFTVSHYGQIMEMSNIIPAATGDTFNTVFWREKGPKADVSLSV